MPNSLSFFIPGPGDDDAPSARGRCQKIVGLPSLPAVSGADALPAEEDNAVLAEDDGREKK